MYGGKARKHVGCDTSSLKHRLFSTEALPAVLHKTSGEAEPHQESNKAFLRSVLIGTYVLVAARETIKRGP